MRLMAGVTTATIRPFGHCLPCIAGCGLLGMCMCVFIAAEHGVLTTCSKRSLQPAAQNTQCHAFPPQQLAKSATGRLADAVWLQVTAPEARVVPAMPGGHALSCVPPSLPFPFPSPSPAPMAHTTQGSSSGYLLLRQLPEPRLQLLTSLLHQACCCRQPCMDQMAVQVAGCSHCQPA